MLTSPSPLQHHYSFSSKNIHEIVTHRDTLERFTSRLREAGEPVRFHCALPSWCPDSDDCLDLHDLHDLRSRFLVFIHGLLETLRAAGVPASYRLIQSDASVCVVCALPPDVDGTTAKRLAFQAARESKVGGRGRVLLTDLQDGSALVIS